MREQCLCDGVGKTGDHFQSYHQEGDTLLVLSVVLPWLEGHFWCLFVSTLLRCVRKGSYQGKFPDVSEWIKAMLFGYGGNTGTVDDMHRSGCPKATAALDDRYLWISAWRNPESNATMLNNAFRAGTGRRVSTQTVRNRLHDAQLHSRRPWRSPHLTPRQHTALNGLVRIGIKFYSQVSVAYAFNQTIIGDVFGGIWSGWTS